MFWHFVTVVGASLFVIGSIGITLYFLVNVLFNMDKGIDITDEDVDPR